MVIENTLVRLRLTNACVGVQQRSVNYVGANSDIIQSVFSGFPIKAFGNDFPFFVMPADFKRASIWRSNLPAAHTTCLWQAKNKFFNNK